MQTSSASISPRPVSPPLESGAKVWTGQLDLRLVQRNGKTIPIHQRATAPLKVQRPFYTSDDTCQMAIVHTAGGMANGDQLDIQINAAEQSSAFITTAAAHKIYRSTGATAQQTIHLEVSPGSCLEWFPQETIVFNGAQFRQALRVDLAPGALWFGWDLTRFGRSARGETFCSGDWQSHTEVWQQGKPLWLDRQYLAGGSAVLDSPHGLAGHPVVGAFVILGLDNAAELLAELRDSETGTPLVPLGPTSISSSRSIADFGITQLQSGILCRYRGGSTQQARRWFINIWQCLKPKITGKIAGTPRVWGCAP